MDFEGTSRREVIEITQLDELNGPAGLVYFAFGFARITNHTCLPSRLASLIAATA